MTNIKTLFIKKIESRFPKLVGQLDPLVSDNLLSPFQIKISPSVIKRAKVVIQEFFKLRQSCSYRENLKTHLIDPKNNSILMSYDFHLDQNEQLKLIEINTNASFLALGSFMNEAHGLKPFDFEILKKDILNELMLFGKNTEKPNIAIIDEQPSQQRLYSEFLLYQQIFKSWGWNCSIKDISEVDGTEDFIYNRSTDFYLEQENSKNLLSLFQNKKVCFSPHPYEYFLLADKQRLVEISQNNLLQLPELPYCKILNLETADEIWSQRKNLFFKPLRSFGAKQSYKGASISKKIFEELVQANVMAQEYVPAGERSFNFDGVEHNFRFDLRFFAYQDQLEFVVARLYQGQVTNLKTPLGGFAPVIY